MAATFKNARAVLTDAGDGTVVYTVPAETTAIIIGCQAANISDASVECNFWWTDASDTNQITFLADSVTVPTGAAYEPIGGKLVLEAGDTLTGRSTPHEELEATVSVLELS